MSCMQWQLATITRKSGSRVSILMKHTCSYSLWWQAFCSPPCLSSSPSPCISPDEEQTWLSRQVTFYSFHGSFFTCLRQVFSHNLDSWSEDGIASTYWWKQRRAFLPVISQLPGVKDSNNEGNLWNCFQARQPSDSWHRQSEYLRIWCDLDLHGCSKQLIRATWP